MDMWGKLTNLMILNDIRTRNFQVIIPVPLQTQGFSILLTWVKAVVTFF